MIENRLLTGTMDSDTEDRHLAQGDYRYANGLRMAISDEDAFGVGENIKGNTFLLTLFPGSSIPDKCIGAFEDKINNVIIFFLSLGSGLHRIYEYDITQPLPTLILESSLLNFSRDHLILHVDRIGDLLYWTDGFNPPRKINIELARTGQYPISLTEQYIDTIQYPPLYPPTIRYDEYQLTGDPLLDQQSINLNQSRIRRKMFQFKYKYVYDDLEESAWSPVSEISKPPVDSDGDDVSEQKSVIIVSLNTGIDRVKKIKLGVRIGNNLDFELDTVIDKSDLNIADNSVYEYTFDNTNVPIPILVQDSISLFDSVPQLAQTQTSIDSRRLVYGNITDGYDPVDLNVKIAPIYSNRATFTPSQTLKDGSRYEVGFQYYDRANRSGAVNKTVETNVIETINNQAVLPSGNLTTVIDREFEGTSIWLDTVMDRARTDNNPTPIKPPQPFISVFSFTHIDLDIEINHIPPVWATHYQILISPNRTRGRFLQFTIGAVHTTNVSGQFTVSLANINRYNDRTGASLSYDFSEGDILRIIVSEVNDPPFGLLYANGTQDYKVISQDTGANTITVEAPENPNYSLIGGMLVEIFSPLLDTPTDTYWEIGEVYEVSNGLHQGGVQNQTASQPAKVLIKDKGDVYVRNRELDVTATKGLLNIPIRDYSYSDLFESNFWDQGRPSINNPDSKQLQRIATYAYSEPFIESTSINGLSTFYDTNFNDYDVQYGEIMKSYYENKRLLSFQELKTGNILVNETVYADFSGQSTVATSQNVLNDITYFTGEYGIGRNPESFAVYGNRKYHVDAARGVVLRLSVDGYTEISEIKMHNYFTDKFDTLQKAGIPFKCFGVYDVRFGEYIISFVNGQDDETLGFSEAKKGWPQFHPFIPEFMVALDTELFTFKDAFLYIHNSNSTYNNFYFTQYTSRLKMAFNIEPNNKKFWKSIGLKTDSGEWFAPEITNRNNQQTSLIKEDFEVNEEEEYYAGLLKDENTQNISNPLINGDDMRSSALTVLLENDSTEYFRIFSVNMEGEISHFTK
jgi:hypothetical protein